MMRRSIFRDLRLQSNRFFIPVAVLILILSGSTPGRKDTGLVGGWWGGDRF